MPKKYNIQIETAAPRFYPVGKYATVEFREDCAGSCRQCVKKKCVYDIFKDNYAHVSSMDEPEYLYTCMSCFRCVQECTKGIFSRVINPEYKTLGDSYWQPHIIHQTWYQAHTGKIPVSGAGYRGPFSGSGFDSMWTDMSEIVRPTRDGIHGREYINTCMELSRRAARLKFNNMSLVSNQPPILEIPVPLLFQQPDFGMSHKNVLLSAVRAAGMLGTMMFIHAKDYTDNLLPYADSLIPRLKPADYSNHLNLIKKSRMIELAYEPGIEAVLSDLRNTMPELIVAAGLPLNSKAAEAASHLTQAGFDTIHLYADSNGMELEAEKPRFLKDMIREVHLKLVSNCIRQKIKLVFSGGIAMAEHMAKAIICGADAVTIENPLLIALECRICHRCKDGLPCPVKIEEADPGWGSQRIINLMGAWRNQLLEVMGAMGIREARRLCGEIGRSMCFEDLEKENFLPIFGKKDAD